MIDKEKAAKQLRWVAFHIPDSVCDDTSEGRMLKCIKMYSIDAAEVLEMSCPHFEEGFKEELTFIKTDWIREQLKIAISHIPDYFYRIPASSTGKYHPSYTLGNQGLYRHVKAATKIAKDLVELEMFELNQEEKDAVISAIILHDCCKSGREYSAYTKHSHPLLAAKLIEEVCSKEFADIVCPLVVSHMGQWTTSKYESVVLPKPETKLQKLVHLCDYLASRKYLEVNFNEEN